MLFNIIEEHGSYLCTHTVDMTLNCHPGHKNWLILGGGLRRKVTFRGLKYDPIRYYHSFNTYLTAAFWKTKLDTVWSNVTPYLRVQANTKGIDGKKIGNVFSWLY